MLTKNTSPMRSILTPAIIPLFIVLAMWIVFLIEFETGANFAVYGLRPRTPSGLIGILTIPFIHGSWSHLINNTLPMLVLGWALFKFYPTLAVRTLLLIYFLGGLWLWISGRSSYHIGASGVVYGLASFLFFSGAWRREKQVAALSLLIAFMYGSMWWGVLPVDPGISWEGHLWGAVAGFILAFLYRKKGPQRTVYQWEIDEKEQNAHNVMLEAVVFEEVQNNEGEEMDVSTSPPSPSNLNINYTFKPKSQRDSSSGSRS